MPNWVKCIFCLRKWDEESLEFELCPECLEELKDNATEYDIVKITQRLKYGEYGNEDIAETLEMIWREMMKMREEK